MLRRALFEQVLEQGAEPAILSRIADVAAATGYADQSHLNRHFKTMWGVSPGAFIANLGHKPG